MKRKFLFIGLGSLVLFFAVAGWTVDGIVQAGHFASAWALRTTDLSDLLATALEFPWGRETLFADDVERIAVGPMLATEEGKESVAALFGTYALFSEKSHDAMARRVVEKLEAERRRRGVEPPEELADVTPLCQRIASAVQAQRIAMVMCGLEGEDASRVRIVPAPACSIRRAGRPCCTCSRGTPSTSDRAMGSGARCRTEG